jgi:hypothetical protein
MFAMTILGRCADSLLRERIGLPIVFLCLVGAVVLGFHMIVRRARHLRGHIGGEIHRDLKETEIQMLGVLVIGGASWAIYEFVVEFLASCLG